MFDCAIIGTGPAGLSAALTLKKRNKSFIWFGSGELSLKIEKTHQIANYPGLTMVSGPEMNAAFRQQIEAEELPIEEKMVTMVSGSKKGFMILGDNDVFDAKTVLFAIGAVTGKTLPGEDALLGHGVSYCATCDGFLYPGKTIAVICGAKRYEHEVKYLAEIAAKVYLQADYEDCEIDLPNVEVLPSRVMEIGGEKKADSVRLLDGTEVPVDGVFILRTSVAPATVLSGLEMDGPHIKVDRECRTNKAGVFAAGDCTGRPYQIAKAIGEGNVAAHSILDYLAEQE